MSVVYANVAVVACELFTENEKVAQTAANPVQDPCDIGVKIADLGNACWTVSAVHYVSFNRYGAEPQTTNNTRSLAVTEKSRNASYYLEIFSYKVIKYAKLSVYKMYSLCLQNFCEIFSLFLILI